MKKLKTPAILTVILFSGTFLAQQTPKPFVTYPSPIDC